MKSLLRAFGLTFLSLTLTNCSLSPEKIASRLEPSIVKVFYQGEPGHGTGFFVPGEKGVCTVLTAAHVVKKEGENLLKTNDGKEWPASKVEIFPNNIDLALVSFQPEKRNCNYSPLKIGNSDGLKQGSSIYISGFPIRDGYLVSQFVLGNVSRLDRLAQGYGVSYQALTVGGMSGAPVVDVKGEVVAVHGMSDVEVVKSFASLQASLSESERSVYQDAVRRVEAGVQRYTFSWGIPINMLENYRGEAIALGTEGQKVELQKQLELERRKREEAERRVEKLEADLQKELREAEKRAKKRAKEERAVELQRQLEEEKRQREEAERRERELEAERQRQKKNEVSLVSAKGVDYRKLRDLLKAKKWQEADAETGRVILKAASRESEGWLRGSDAKNFSCQDLGTIDKLWVKYSNGKFGFSVQKQIYLSLGGTKEYNRDVWEKFGDKVGWSKGGQWLSYSELTFDDKHYVGHLPFSRNGFWPLVKWWNVVMHQPYDCNI
ncbi:GUN4 domain-containing protein [Trichodesmium erythraeum 21-75]|nr:GUN4 domain-containing protein [Trichodesmium erythraeum 21-75]